MTHPFATCDFCDAHKGDTTGSFRVLPPVFRDFGQITTFCGPVDTVKCFEDNTLVKAAVDAQGWISTPKGGSAKCWWLMAAPHCAEPCSAATWARPQPATAGPAS